MILILVGSWRPLIFLLGVSIVAAQDLSIRGLFSFYTTPYNSQELDLITSTCFNGMNLVTCAPILADDDFTLSTELDYYKDLATSVGQFYCVQCCGTPLNYIDTWNLYCSTSDAINNGVNLFGYELRLARRRTQTDRGVVTCPLRRSACTYAEDGTTLSCDQSSRFTYLIGYTVTIQVKRYNENFKYWNGVTECNIETVESNTSLSSTEKFRETFILVHKPLNDAQLDNFKILILLVLVIFVLYVGLYFCRKARCVYCQQKLVFSPKMCYKCRIVGAEMPDPVLMRSLEEKGERIQGEPPDNVLSIAFLFKFVGDKITACCFCSFYYACYCCCFMGNSGKKNPLRRLKSSTVAVLPISVSQTQPPMSPVSTFSNDFISPRSTHGKTSQHHQLEDKEYDSKDEEAKQAPLTLKTKRRTLYNAVDSNHPANSDSVPANGTVVLRAPPKDDGVTAGSLLSATVALPAVFFHRPDTTGSSINNNTSMGSTAGSKSTEKIKKNKVPKGMETLDSTAFATIDAKRSTLERVLNLHLNPNFLPYDQDVIKAAVRHPTCPDTVDEAVGQIRLKETENRLRTGAGGVGISVFHPYDPHSVLHRSLVNTHEVQLSPPAVQKSRPV